MSHWYGVYNKHEKRKTKETKERQVIEGLN